MNAPHTEAVLETVLKETTSKCPVCHKPKPAQVIKVKRDGKEQVIMRRTCPCHGTFEFLLASDANFYWLAKGDTGESPRGDCGCGSACSAGGGRDGYLGTNATDESRSGVIEKLSTCLALIEVTDSCNMACPECFADSPVGIKGDRLKYSPFDNLVGRIQGVIDRKGHIEILQLSGGEPTLHPELFRLIEWARTNPKIDYVLINTNGIRFAKDAAFMEEMGRLFLKYDNIQLYLQFDGPQEDGQLELRGADMREVRKKAIENCAKFGIPVTLAMVVNDTTVNHLWDTVAFGIQHENVRGVSFQPDFISGRNWRKLDDAVLPQPITVADVIHGLHDQSGRAIDLGDFTPLPCGDPNCSIIGWVFRMAGKTYSPTEFGIDLAALQAKLPDRVNYRLEDLAKCGCDGTELGDLMKSLEVKESNAFRLFIKPFMDERTWDQHRIDRCCTHVIDKKGKLRSFCEYYSRPPNLATCC